ncbi:hypothetical protein F2P56_012392 [Juglans regia]|uniref:Uncharacterized protein n=1 Tax=Juglans regia TaxID=51240 RepID=A0A833WRJ0_JUGRE|nr:hypothetical protein F2P56_037248 [Juglans regia]KAF5468221.1 hypothetical protein F2P56_012392 [Juglans regia]
MEDSNVGQIADKAIEVQEATPKSCSIEDNASKSGDVQVRHGIAIEALKEAVIVANPSAGVVLRVVSDVSFELLSDEQNPSSVGQWPGIVWRATRHKIEGWRVQRRSRTDTRKRIRRRWGRY